MQRILIWDWPTRLVHWLLVALVFFSWGSAEYHQMELHRYSGYALLGLVVFRLYWGFFGSATARFSNFIKGPRAIVAYLRGFSSGPSAQGLAPRASSIGHNPLGALSVIALLLLLAAQVILGLFAVDIDGLESGPLSYLVSFEVGRECAKIHATVFNVLLGLIALHVVAILFYLIFKRDNLLGPMIVGRKSVPPTAADPQVAAPLLRVLIGIALAGAAVWAIV